jgi:hypothetical protein
VSVTRDTPHLEGDFEHLYPKARLRNIRRIIFGTLLTTIMVAGVNLHKTARPAVAHLAAHGYSILGLGFISAAAYRHSLFTGLLVTGVCFLVFEWKASE